MCIRDRHYFKTKVLKLSVCTVLNIVNSQSRHIIVIYVIHSVTNGKYKASHAKKSNFCKNKLTVLFLVKRMKLKLINGCNHIMQCHM